jgi:glycosyltransferase involved in cell wall biosynthesis
VPEKIAIITPTTGSKYLIDCIESVQKQTYQNFVHYIVFDGIERYRNYNFNHLKQIEKYDNVKIIILPEATGINYYYGHRINGAMSFIVNAPLVCWLDDDNLFKQYHLEEMHNFLIENDLAWCYCLREIIDENGVVICNDDCESIGIYPTILSKENKPDYLIDVSCYLMPTNLAVMYSHIWYRKGNAPNNNQITPDRLLCRTLMEQFPKFGSTGIYSLQYRIGSSDTSVKSDFFLKGNELRINKNADKRFINIK